MGNYIIRIYQRRPRHSAMTGILEVVESGEKLAFHNDQQLWDLLAKAEAGARKSKAQEADLLAADKPDGPRHGK